MRILLVGGGGREHAIAWKLKQSSRVSRLLWTPGNGAAEALGERADVAAGDVPGLVKLAGEMGADLVVVGPEVPLAKGLTDELEEKGIACFGPSREAARIESSKVFSKNFCVKNNIPTPSFEVCSSWETAREYIENYGGSFPLVVTADGRAAGKGVLICANRNEALNAAESILRRRTFGDAGSKLLIEAFLEGEEASLMVFTDGKTIVPMPIARDHKRVGDGDRGLNTGGMGAYCPSARISRDRVDEAMEKIVRPAIEAMARAGHPYRGVLYAGLMLTEYGPQLLEFNCRFGDPETQVVLPLLSADLAEIAYACARGGLTECKVAWKNASAVTVVLCSGGYPLSYKKGMVIAGVKEAGANEDTVIFHAGTKLENGKLLTSGGRVLGVTALGETTAVARVRAYAAAAKISFDGMFYRRDIADGVQ